MPSLESHSVTYESDKELKVSAPTGFRNEDTITLHKDENLELDNPEFRNYYKLTVTDGTGDGSYKFESEVPCTETCPTDTIKDTKWSGDTALVAGNVRYKHWLTNTFDNWNVNNNSTSRTIYYKMPAKDTEIKALYSRHITGKTDYQKLTIQTENVTQPDGTQKIYVNGTRLPSTLTSLSASTSSWGGGDYSSSDEHESDSQSKSSSGATATYDLSRVSTITMKLAAWFSEGTIDDGRADGSGSVSIALCDSNGTAVLTGSCSGSNSSTDVSLNVKSIRDRYDLTHAYIKVSMSCRASSSVETDHWSSSASGTAYCSASHPICYVDDADRYEWNFM